MADNQATPRPSIVTLQEAMGQSPKLGQEPPKSPAMVHKDALVKTDLPRPKGGYASEKLKWYHLGVLPGCPHQTVHVNGMCFTLAAETVLINRDTKATERSKRRGDFVKLSEEEVAKTIAKVKRKVIRWENKATLRGHIENMDKPGFALQPGDEPLGWYLFLREAPVEMVDSALNPLTTGAGDMMTLVEPEYDLAKEPAKEHGKEPAKSGK